MSTSAVLRAGGLVVGNIPMGASGSERGRDLNRNLRGSNSLQETETGFGFIWIF